MIHEAALLIKDQEGGRAYITMNESVQTSVEQINLLAAQLRYKIDCALQQSISTHQRYLQVPIDDIDEKGAETNAEVRPTSNETVSAAASLEIDYLHREILDLKQVIEKLANQLKLKDSAFKNIKDELKQEKSYAEITLRDHRQIVIEAKANERYVKCVQTEYELLQSMTVKSQEAFLAISNESLKHAIDFDKTAKMVQKQMKEIMGKNVEIRNLQEDLKRLHTDITNQRAAAGLNASSLKFSQLEVERLTEREMRLDVRISSLTERVERERHINTMLNQTVEETESKANKAFEGIQVASNQQSDLLIRYNNVVYYVPCGKLHAHTNISFHSFSVYVSFFCFLLFSVRLSKVNSEILALKATLQEQQSVPQSGINQRCKINENGENSNKLNGNSVNSNNDNLVSGDNDDIIDHNNNIDVSINNGNTERNVVKLDQVCNLKNERVTSNIDMSNNTSDKNRFVDNLGLNDTNQVHDDHPAEDQRDDKTECNRKDSRAREIKIEGSKSEQRENERESVKITPSVSKVEGISSDIQGRMEESNHMDINGSSKKQKLESTIFGDNRVTSREFQSVMNMRKVRQENKDNYKNKDDIEISIISKSDSSSHCKLNSPRVLQAQALRIDKEPLRSNRGITSSILSHFNDATRNII